MYSCAKSEFVKRKIFFMVIIQEMEQESVWTRTVVSIPMLYFSTSIWIWWMSHILSDWQEKENWSKFHQNSNEILWTCQAYSKKVILSQYSWIRVRMRTQPNNVSSASSSRHSGMYDPCLTGDISRCSLTSVR